MFASVVLRPIFRKGPGTGVRYYNDMIAHKIGNREVVGHGWSGLPVYADRVDFPMPPIRFKEPTPEIMALREKETCDWHKLTVQEKKALYRASFCQTFAEMKYPTGEWKEVLGMGFLVVSLGLMVTMWMKAFVYGPYPETFSDERQKAQIKRVIDLNMHPILGISSKWDYENNKWK